MYILLYIKNRTSHLQATDILHFSPSTRLRDFYYLYPEFEVPIVENGIAIDGVRETTNGFHPHEQHILSVWNYLLVPHFTSSAT
jgi:hypothetical protein